jgi:hypothetical protein
MSPTSNFKKIHLKSQADTRGKMDRHDEAKRRFMEECEYAWNKGISS